MTEGTVGCKFWRVRSITDTPGQWWQVKELEFYTSANGSGDKVVPSKAMASSFLGDLNESENKAEKAIDGSADTFWSTSDKYKFEWIGVEFETPQEIASIKMQITDEFMGPAMVIVEKSFDGEWWSRSTEIMDMGDWSQSMVTYPLIVMSTVPKSLFAFRSQDNPRFCVGVRPTPHPTDEKADPYPLFEDARLEVQICNDKTNTQYWQLTDDPRPMLKNAADQSFVMPSNAVRTALRALRMIFGTTLETLLVGSHTTRISRTLCSPLRVVLSKKELKSSWKLADLRQLMSVRAPTRTQQDGSCFQCLFWRKGSRQSPAHPTATPTLNHPLPTTVRLRRKHVLRIRSAPRITGPTTLPRATLRVRCTRAPQCTRCTLVLLGGSLGSGQEPSNHLQSS